MKRFGYACKAEVLKTVTTRSWWILALVMVLFVGFTAAMLGLGLGVLAGSTEDPSLGSLHLMIYSLGSAMGYVFPVLVGALSVTGEYRHHTMTPTFLSVGSRGPVLAAKATVMGALGLLYGVLSAAAAVLGSVFFLMASKIDTGLSSAATWEMLLRSVVVMGIWAVVGVGLGALIRSQAGAIVVVLVFTQFIEPIARTAGAFNEVVATITQYLPGALSDAFVGSSLYLTITAAVSEPLTWWVAGLLLAGYGLVLLIVAYLTRWKADVS